MGIREGLLALLDVSVNPPTPDTPAPPPPPPAAQPSLDLLQALAARVASLEVIVSGLPGLWDDQAKRTERAAARAETAARRRTQRADDDAGEPEDDDRQLRLIDGERSDARRVQPVRTEVAAAPATDLSAVRQAVAFQNKAL